MFMFIMIIHLKKSINYLTEFLEIQLINAIMKEPLVSHVKILTSEYQKTNVLKLFQIVLHMLEINALSVKQDQNSSTKSVFQNLNVELFVKSFQYERRNNYYDINTVFFNYF
jgi:hypothetical protein